MEPTSKPFPDFHSIVKVRKLVRIVGLRIHLEVDYP